MVNIHIISLQKKERKKVKKYGGRKGRKIRSTEYGVLRKKGKKDGGRKIRRERRGWGGVKEFF
jgi:hypothetical protein